MPNTLSKTAIGSRIQEVNQLESEDLCLWLVADNGYRDARVLADGSVAALIDLLYTHAIATGCSWDGWGNRYCFEDIALADKRFAELRSEDDVPEGHIATRQGWNPIRRQAVNPQMRAR
ncbi:MAG: hypothetical protein IPG23_13470 [Burkholderiales bacterium]|jgi:hypothetical protein|nr:hypothetical protein [Burkholderiales bacterium]